MPRYCVDCDADISPLKRNAKRCPECGYKHRVARDRAAADRYRDPSLAQKLAAMVIIHLKIPHEAAKTMSINQILSLVEWDHYPVARNTAIALKWEAHEINHPSNLQPLCKDVHAVKTRTIDIPQAAKGKRLTKAHEEHRRRMLAPEPAEPQPKSRWPQGRKMQSRSFAKKETA